MAGDLPWTRYPTTLRFLFAYLQTVLYNILPYSYGHFVFHYIVLISIRKKIYSLLDRDFN